MYYEQYNINLLRWEYMSDVEEDVRRFKKGQ